MRRLLTALLLPPMVALSGCGSGIPPGPAPNALVNTVVGNWQMQVQSSVTGPGTVYFDLLGELSVSGSSVSGTFQIPSTLFTNFPCHTSATQSLSFSGSLSSEDLLTLTSAPFSGSVATLQLQLPIKNVGGTGLAIGTISIAGGPCAYPSTPVEGVLVPPLNGTFAGTFALQQLVGGQRVSGPSLPATILYKQSAANTLGQFPLSANISINSSSCTFSATITGIISGLEVEMFPGGPGYASTVPNATLLGGAPLSPTQILRPVLTIGASTSACPEGVYEGSNFTLQ